MQFEDRIREIWRHLVFRIFDYLRGHGKTSHLARHAARLHPEDSVLAHNIGWRYCTQGDYEKAEQQLRRAAALDPHDAAAHYNLGIALSSQERWKEALAEFQNSTALRPDSSEFCVGLGSVKRKLVNIRAQLPLLMKR